MPELNQRPFKKLPGNRQEAFEQLDAPHLKPMNPRPYEPADWHKAKVNIDYHIEFDGNYYSVPHALVGHAVDVRATRRLVEVIVRNRRVASHPRSHKRGKFETVSAHMPDAHRRHAEWTPNRFVDWGQSVGPETGRLIYGLLERLRHPEQGYRSCLGLMRLARQVGRERLEGACRRAVGIGAYSYRSVASILDSGLDAQPLLVRQAEIPLPDHANVRGPAYYH